MPSENWIFQSSVELLDLIHIAGSITPIGTVAILSAFFSSDKGGRRS